MPTRTPSPKEKGTLITDAGRRRSMRVLLSVPVMVSGKDAEDKPFSEEGRTLVVNAHGALIALSTRVLANQQITVANKTTQQTQQCRVVHIGSPQAGKIQLGLEFVKPSPSFWHIDFPPDDWVVPED